MHSTREDYPRIHTSEKVGRRGWANDQAIENLQKAEKVEAKRQRDEDQKETDQIERDKRGD